MEKVRMAYWDNLKGMLIAGVFATHLLEIDLNLFSIFPRIWCIFLSTIMPVFIFTNGVFFRKSSRDPIEKFPRMIAAYLTVQVLCGAYYDWAAGVPLALNFSQPYYCCWYLLYISLACVLMSVVRRAGFDGKKAVAAAVVLAVLAGFDRTVGYEYSASRFFHFMPFLFLGYYIDAEELKTVVKEKKVWAVGLFFLSALFVFWLAGTGHMNREIFEGMKSYEALFPGQIYRGVLAKGYVYLTALFALLGLMALTPEKPTVFTVLGRHTLAIYMTHIVVITPVYHLLLGRSFVSGVRLNNLILRAIAGAAAALACAAVIAVSNRLSAAKKRRSGS